MTRVLVVAVVSLAIVAVLTTVWSLSWDLRAYREWKRERTVPQPRYKRRQRERAATQEEEEAKRWRRLMLALQCAAFCFLGGLAASTAGWLTMTPWLMVGGANLLFLGILAWIAYQLVLPKPTALREKKLPDWISRRTSQRGE